MSFTPKDHYYKKAKEMGFKARSAFKLDEIEDKYHIFKGAHRFLDLGCSPGSWSQWILKRAESMGAQSCEVLGVDLTPVELGLKGFHFIQGDMRELNLNQVFESLGSLQHFDIVLSDMAPKTTGIKLTDQARSFELCEIALDTAQKWLKPSGHVVIKLFHSEEFSELKKRILLNYKRFEAFRPKSTRSMSKEIFLIGINKKG